MNYCEHCGAALEERVDIVGYEPLDGRPRYAFTRWCPRRSRFFNAHTNVMFVGLSRAEADKAQEWEWHGW